MKFLPISRLPKVTEEIEENYKNLIYNINKPAEIRTTYLPNIELRSYRYMYLLA
jgi:hypothetical protein